jgi:dephospho-CoA kinase
MKVAITGNIGSGKSTYTKFLAKALPEYKHVDVDELVSRLYSDKAFCDALQSHFGTADRKQVSDIVFADPTKRLWLEKQAAYVVRSMLHFETLHANVLVEFPLLFEMAAQGNYEHVITVFCDEKLQMQRVKDRNQFSDEKIKSIMGAQMSTHLKTLLANTKIDSDCTKDELWRMAKAEAAKIRAMDLRERFLTSSLGSKQNYSAIWDAIFSAYTEDGRYYHVLEHLAYMFYQFDQVRHLLKYPAIVEEAIWFHDIVYHANSKGYLNEERSVQRMFELYNEYAHIDLQRMSGNIPVLATAGEFILSTKGHAITSPYLLANPDLKHDCEIFLDIDLSVLFSDAWTLEQFEHGVRQEYRIYNESEYAHGRVAALQTFLNRPKVLYSQAFADQEPQARCSLERIIAKWQAVIDGEK